jgi:endoglucanase
VILRGVSLIDLGTTEQRYGGARQMIDRLTDKNDSDGGVTGWYPTVLRIAIYPADSPDVRSPSTFQAGSDDFYNQLLRPVVDHCKDKGVYAILDWHYIDDTTQHRQTTEQFWRYVSAKFAGDSHVLFELYNEPINNGDWSSVRVDMQSWYDLVRQSAPDNLVLVGTPNWCQNVGPTADNPVDGTNIAYVAHMYPMHWKSQDLRNQITTAAAKHPVFMSEWGFQPNAPGDSTGIVDGTATSYGNPFKEFVEQNKTSWTVWCASYDWFPSMFNQDWTLRTGENGMGGFVKQWLYEKRDSDLPGGS